MLQFQQSRFTKMLSERLATGTVLSEEGQALVAQKENGELVVVPSTGVAGELFAGISIIRNAPPAAVPVVEDDIASADGFSMTRTAIAGQLLVKVAGVPATIVTGTPAVAGEVQINGTTVVYHAGDYSKTVVFQYLYSPTVEEARTILGDAPYGGFAANLIGRVTVVKQGQVATSFFDASADWTSALQVELGANGKFIPAVADPIPGVMVKNSPNVGAPFLVLELNVA